MCLVCVCNSLVVNLLYRFVLVNTDERKCLSSVHPSGVLTGVDQGNAPGNLCNCRHVLHFED